MKILQYLNTEISTYNLFISQKIGKEVAGLGENGEGIKQGTHKQRKTHHHRQPCGDGRRERVVGEVEERRRGDKW